MDEPGIISERADIGPALPSSSLVEVLRWRAVHEPARRAYTYLLYGETEEVSVSYGELDRRARAIAASLQSMGLEGERALLLYPQSLEFIAAFFGCLYARVAAIPLYPPKPKDRSLSRIYSIAQDAGAGVVLTTAAILSKTAPLFTDDLHFKSMRFLATDDLKAGIENAWQEPSITSEALAFLQYTSGSTANPKGVMVGHKNLMHNLSLLHWKYELTRQSVFVSWLPLFHDMGLIIGTLLPLYGGFPDILMSPASFAQRPVRWLLAISRYKGTISAAPNFAYDLCTRKIPAEQRALLDLSSWAVAISGAEPVRAETIEQFVSAFGSYGFRLQTFNPGYGLAEATVAVSVGPKAGLPVIKNCDRKAHEQDRLVRAPGETGILTFVGCGQTWPGHRIVIANPETMGQCAPAQVGEIWVSGPSVTQGYWNQPEETEDTFRAYLSDTGEGPFLRTGDLGFLQDGELFITGRLKDLVIIRGRCHYPQDIEATVELSHAALRPGCGAAFSVEVGNEERLVVVQEAEQRTGVDAAEIIRCIRHAVSEQHDLQIHEVGLIRPGSIPKTSSGKIQRRTCRDAFLTKRLSVWQALTIPESDGR